ncbi:hypothetical protein CLV79_105212 [Limimaricola soesokkakensis]|uniref:Uncharacterized protein n=1 Tax=Limimaricola soesokkakensis TaxID=1343159 RepID=A0A1X6Z9U7_9RHOB|nr:hypothetical protein CLV79_105212 [Limimaricola soesokkakensis]SLN44861.1 hypothetical protein LOS8367_01960 [Limimaricola soesokkakensis]
MRLEAMARPEPEVGNLWRLEIALAEAVASAGFEGVRISEGNLPPRIAQNGSQDADPPGAELVLSQRRFQPWSPGSETGRSRSRDQRQASVRATEQAFADLQTSLGKASALLIGAPRRR